jgi:hypothetical protein
MTAPDLSRYNPPGVYTSATPGPQISVQSATPSAVGIFGVGRGYQTDLQTITIPDDDGGNPVASAVLRRHGLILDSIVVTDATTGTVYTQQSTTSPPNGDYAVVSTTGPSGVSGGFDSSYQIVRVLGGLLAAGAQVQVSFHYTDENYYLPHRIYDFQDAESLFGPALNTDGTVASELTLACSFAFLNGARTIVAAAVKNPNSPQVSDYRDALATFEGILDISVVVCANGSSGLHTAVRDHVVSQSSARAERKAILGVDGSSTAIDSSTLISYAQAIESSRVALVSPAVVNYYNTSLNKTVVLGGQYLAAALAGVAVSLSPATPLTRKQVLGFASVPNAADAQKSRETQGGLLVIDSLNNTGSLRVRHGVTTDPSSIVTREWSILSQQDAMSFRLRSFFDTDGIIGSIITDTTMANVKASAESALQSLIADQSIASYQGLTVRQSSTNLDVVQISFAWKASLPLNYIVVQFTLDVTSGDTTTTI